MTSNTIILDLETAYSAEDCQHCGRAVDMHNNLTKGWSSEAQPVLHCQNGGHTTYTPLGWDNKAALGLSIGCYWDGADQRCHFFDVHMLEATVRLCVERQPLLVSFNGIAFDFSLMRALLRQEGEHDRIQSLADASSPSRFIYLQTLCDAFKTLCTTSYDILAEIWQVDPVRAYERGLNSLDAISQANGLGPKLSHDAQAPRDWREGRYAQVINYCQDDVYKTKALFELICAGRSILRGDGQPIVLRNPFPQEAHDE